MEHDLGIPAIRAWFSALPASDKVYALLVIMHEITIVMRTISVDYPHDCETRWRLAYRLSQMNHRFTAAALAMMLNEPTYPDDELLEILLRQERNPELARACRQVLEDTVEIVNTMRAGKAQNG